MAREIDPMDEPQLQPVTPEGVIGQVAGGGPIPFTPEDTPLPTVTDLETEEAGYSPEEAEATNEQIAAYEKLLTDEPPFIPEDSPLRLSDDDLNKVFLQRLDHASSFRQSFEPRWLKGWTDWWQIVGPDVDRWRSKVFLPFLYTQHATWQAGMMTTLWKSPFVIGVRATKSSQDQNAKSMERVIDWQLRCHDGPAGELEDWVFYAGLIGSGVIRTGWVTRNRILRVKEPVHLPDPRTGKDRIIGTKLVNRNVKVYDGPELYCVDPYNFWACPYSLKGDARMPWAIERVETTEEDLRSLVKQGLYLDPNAAERIEEYLEERTEAKLDDGPIAFAESRVAALQAVGIASPYEMSSPSAEEDDSKRRAVILYEHWTADYVLGFATDGRLLYKSPFPFTYDDVPYVRASFQRIPKCFYQRGMADVVGPIQSQINFNYNHANDTAQLRLNAPILARRSGNALVEGQVKRLKPGQIIPTRDPQTDVRPLEIPETIREALLMEEHLAAHADKATGVTEMSRGVVDKGVNTATEASILESFVGLRRGHQTELFNQSLRRLGNQLIALNQQFLSQEVVVRVAGQSGLDYVTIKPEDIVGRFDVVAGASIGKSNPGVVRQDTLALYQLLNNDPYVDQVELKKWLLQTWECDQEKIDKLIMPPPAPPRDPRLENMVLAQGTPLPPSPDEDFMAHMAEHERYLEELRMEPIQNSRAIEAVQGHLSKTGELFLMVSQALLAGGSPQGPGGAPSTGSPGTAPPEAGASPLRREATQLGAAQGSFGPPGRSPGPAAPPNRRPQ